LTNDNISQSIVTLKINLYDEVFTSVRKIKRGEIISQNDFSVCEKEITHLRNNAVDISKMLNNVQASVNIGENMILQENMIEKLPDVKAGDKVFAFSNVGTVTVTFPVTVREDGRTGETIRVLRDDKLIFKAVVIDSKNVKIIE
ncbi:MAG: flagellar basal body P-ring formation protein FlgA, partial [Melioribacteraceae bacterium]